MRFQGFLYQHSSVLDGSLQITHWQICAYIKNTNNRLHSLPLQQIVHEMHTLHIVNNTSITVHITIPLWGFPNIGQELI